MSGDGLRGDERRWVSPVPGHASAFPRAENRAGVMRPLRFPSSRRRRGGGRSSERKPVVLGAPGRTPARGFSVTAVALAGRACRTMPAGDPSGEARACPGAGGDRARRAILSSAPRLRHPAGYLTVRPLRSGRASPGLQAPRPSSRKTVATGWRPFKRGRTRASSHRFWERG